MQRAVLFKIKEGKTDRWREWCHDLATTLREEALVTLEEERVLHELMLGFSLDGTDYVIGYADGECLAANMDREINQRHKAMKLECLERVDGDVQILYDLKLGRQPQ